jgi:hypothetical protein
MDTSFFRAGGRLDEVTMLNAPVTSVPRTATYKIDYNNDNLINKPNVHVNICTKSLNVINIEQPIRSTSTSRYL